MARAKGAEEIQPNAAEASGVDERLSLEAGRCLRSNPHGLTSGHA